jgi:pyruvate dehydrogenase E1 component beta subunit
MAKKSWSYAVLEGIAQEMRADPSLSIAYEYQIPVGISPDGTLLDLVQEFGDVRTASRWGWPLDETWYGGWAIGMGMSGVKAIAHMPSMAHLFITEYMYQQGAKLRAMTGGQATMPIVIWIDISGRSAGQAAQHADCGEEYIYAGMPGCKVVLPSNAYDAKGLMIAAIRDPDPVVFIDQPGPHSGEQPDVPDEAYEVPIGKAVIRQEGTDLTIVAWGDAAVQVKNALPDIAAAGISAEFIDPRTIKPFDTDTLVASVQKTNKLLVVDHGFYTSGFGSHVISEAAQAVHGAYVKKITFPDAPAPFAREMINWMTPDAPKIVDAAKQMAAL